MGKYYNNVNDCVTEYRFRIKTEKEFEEEYGLEWKSKVNYYWNEQGHMDFLFGKNLEKKIPDIIIIDRNFSTNVFNPDINNRSWTVSFDMIKENEKLLFDVIYNNSKKLVYE